MSTTTNLSQSEWLDLAQADREGPFSKRTLWTFISTGQLPVYRPLKRKVLIKRSDLNRLLEASRVGVDIDALVEEVVSEVTGNGRANH